MDLSGFLSGSQSLIQALVSLIFTSIAIVIGSWLIASAFYRMFSAGKGENRGMPVFFPVAIKLLIGSIFMQLARMADGIVEVMFGASRSPSNNALSYMPAVIQGNEFWAQLTTVIAMWISFYGLFAICRGLLLFNKLSEGSNHQGNDLGSRGLTHIIGGGFCYNIGGLGGVF